MTRIGIHGLGRIGRAILRASLDGHEDIVAINDSADDGNLLYLTKYDSIHGRFPVPVDRDGDAWLIRGQRVARLDLPAIDAVPWAALGADVVVDASGTSSVRECRAVLDSGVRSVLVTRPEQAADATVVAGVNEHVLESDDIRLVSTSTCDANAAALVLRALEPLEVLGGTLLTLHPWLGYQNLLDGPTGHFPVDRRDDYALGRASSINLIPKQTSLLGALSDVLPRSAAALVSMSYRVPTYAVSCLNFSVALGRLTGVDGVNRVLAQAAGRAGDGSFSYSSEALVSVDFRGSTAGATLDARWTEVVGQPGLLRLVAWYDNETGYAHQVLRVVRALSGRPAVRPVAQLARTEA